MPDISSLSDILTPHYDTITIVDWIGGVSGPLPLSSDPINPKDAATKGYVDAATTGFARRVSITDQPPPNPTVGDTWWDSQVGQMFIWYQDPNTSQWVIANNTGIQDAPVGTNAYGRLNNQWVPVLPLSGGIMAGPLVLWQDPTSYFMAATKGYVDIQLGQFLPLSGGQMYGQLTLANDPINQMHAATKQYVDNRAGLINVSDAPPPNPTQGKLWFDSLSAQLFIYFVDPSSSQWVQANSPAFMGGGSVGAVAYVSDTAPPSPVQGLLWVQTPENNLYCYIGGTWTTIVAGEAPPA